MTKTFEDEVDKIVELFAKDQNQKDIKKAIINLFNKYDSGQLKDKVIDKSHISDRQIEMF